MRALVRAAALGIVALLAAATAGCLGPPAAAAVAVVEPGDVQLAVLDVTPNSPALSRTPAQKLAITLRLTNTSGSPIDNVIISAERGDPIITQKTLDQAIAKPQPPSPDLVSPLKATATADVPAGASTTVVFRTTTDITSAGDLCLCADAIYPIWLTAAYVPTNGPSVQLDTTQTYLPSFTEAPAKTRVSWVWPLLDRPHRLTQDTVFTDDDLADEVRTGGRLDQLLSVVEQVAGRVPMTLITDPELIDELAVMAQVGTPRPYRVTIGTRTTVGTGVDAAKAWLGRLGHVLTTHPDVELGFTPFADPAVESLTRNGLSWQSAPSGAAQTRITRALGLTDTPLSDIAWPANGVLSQGTLDSLAADGAKTVIVTDRALPRGTGKTIVPDALAPLRTVAGTVRAAITSTPVERLVGSVLDPTGAGLADLPKLVAQLALRVVISPKTSHYVLISPPRADLTVDPAVAVRAILATATTPWSTPLALRAATAEVKPVDHGRLRTVGRSATLPDKAVDAIRYVTHALPGLARFYDPADPGASAARAALEVVPPALQRCESTSLVEGDPDTSTAWSNQLLRRIRIGIQDKVRLVRPANGVYTLNSKTSDLPVTVVNELAVAVQVRIDVSPAVPGLSVAKADEVRSIKANTKVQIKLPTTVQRVGRIAVTVSLSTPDGLPLGTPISLTVHSTALGTVGVWITVGAAIVLVLALLVRFTRQVVARRRGNRPAGTEPAPPVKAVAP